mmetsp:Transcript_20926/g.45375  ORF Transcript_20926/g.45375 Transcript_20926/m.45375 type:complete len:126 (+) Transcript_20926:3321-3698(+)
MEYSIREKLIKIIGGDIVNATMSLARMKVQGKYITEVYGKPANNADSPMGTLWEECLSKTIHMTSSLDRIGTPKPRKEMKSRRASLLRTAESTPRMRLTVMPVMVKSKSAWTGMMMAAIEYSDSD